jgi:hypothetical protein
MNPAPVPHRAGPFQQPSLMCYSLYPMYFLHNTATGNFLNVHIGSISNDLHKVDYNNYSGMAYSDQWAYLPIMSPQQWMSTQKDVNSLLPQ